MRFKPALVLLLATSCLAGCASRIKKLPVPPEQRIQARQAMIEGDQLMREGKDHLALLRYVEASTLDPFNEVVFNKVAVGYSRLLRFDLAKKAIDRAVRLNPDYAYGHNTRGIIFLATQDLGQAIESFQRAIQHIPGKAAFHVNLGNAYLQKGRFEKGRQELLTAVALDPRVFEYKGVIQVASLRAEPTPEHSYQMAKLFAELGDRETALHYLRKAFVAGFRDAARLRKEPAFKRLLQDPEFVDLTNGYGLQI